MCFFAETWNVVFRVFSPGHHQRFIFTFLAEMLPTQGKPHVNQSLGMSTVPVSPRPKPAPIHLSLRLCLSSALPPTARTCSKVLQICPQTPHCQVHPFFEWLQLSVAIFPRPLFKSISMKTWLNLSLSSHLCFSHQEFPAVNERKFRYFKMVMKLPQCSAQFSLSISCLFPSSFVLLLHRANLTIWCDFTFYPLVLPFWNSFLLHVTWFIHLHSLKLSLPSSSWWVIPESTNYAQLSSCIVSKHSVLLYMGFSEPLCVSH